MAAIIRNRGDLKRQVLRVLDAAEDEEFQARVDYWVDLGLQDVFSVLRAWWAVRAATAQVEEDGAIILPPSYLAMVTVCPIGGGKPLTIVTPEQGVEMMASGGPPTSYMLEGLLMTLLPLQTADYQARFTYYSMLEPLEEDADINMYCTRANSALMYAAASHGAVYRGDSELATQMAGMALSRIESINSETQAGRFGTGVVMQRQGR